jgi:hypothetical protein
MREPDRGGFGTPAPKTGLVPIRKKAQPCIRSQSPRRDPSSRSEVVVL